MAEPKEHYWFCLQKILEFPQVDGGSRIWNKVVSPFLDSVDLSDNEFAQETLSQLYDVIRAQKIIHYFNETSQEINHVLDVFIRTNSGGTKLAFSDLLMSIAVANWKGDFRQELDNLTNHIHQSIDMGFYIERDWILKTCLMLTDADIRFKVKNFKAEQVEKIQSEWQSIKDCIKATFLLVRRLGINPQSLTSKKCRNSYLLLPVQAKRGRSAFIQRHQDSCIGTKSSIFEETQKSKILFQCRGLTSITWPSTMSNGRRLANGFTWHCSKEFLAGKRIQF